MITEPYVRLRAKPSDDAAISGQLRYGDVARISAIGTVVARVNGERHYWFELATDAATGWALDTVLEAYNSELRARNASARLER